MDNANRKQHKPWLRLLLGTALSAILIVILTRQVSWAEMSRNLAEFPIGSILASSTLVMLSLPLRACQWYWLLGANENLTWPKVFRAICLGHVGNLFLPMRGGELLKAGVLSRSAAMPVERVLTGVVLCRLQDLLPIACIFLTFGASVELAAVEQRLGLATGSLTSWHAAPAIPRSIAITGMVVVVGGLAFAVLVWRNRARFRALREHNTVLARVSRWVAGRMAQVIAAVKTAGHPARFLAALAAASACWVLFTLASVPMLLGIGIPWHTSLYAALAITGATTFFQMLPSAPMAVGTFHAGCTMALLWVVPEVGETRALAFAVVLHGIGAFSPALPAILLILPWKRTRLLSQFGNKG